MSVPNTLSRPLTTGHATTDPATPRPSLHLDWEAWLPYLDDLTATEAEKRKLIETLWSIVIAFVDLQWDIAPATAAPETCGQDLDLAALLNAAVLHSDRVAEQKEEA